MRSIAPPSWCRRGATRRAPRKARQIHAGSTIAGCDLRSSCRNPLRHAGNRRCERKLYFICGANANAAASCRKRPFRLAATRRRLALQARRNIPLGASVLVRLDLGVLAAGNAFEGPDLATAALEVDDATDERRLCSTMLA